MFWKLVLTATVVLVIAGRTSALRNPLVRLILPRSWSIALSALPGRFAASPRTTPPSSGEPPKPWLGRRGRIVLIAVILAGLAAWMATRAMIGRQADVAIDSSNS